VNKNKYNKSAAKLQKKRQNVIFSQALAKNGSKKKKKNDYQAVTNC